MKRVKDCPKFCLATTTGKENRLGSFREKSIHGVEVIVQGILENCSNLQCLERNFCVQRVQ